MNCEHRFEPYPDSLKIFCPKCGLALDPFSPAQQPTPPPVRASGRVAVRRRKPRETLQPPDAVAAAEAELARQLRAQAEERAETDEDLDTLADTFMSMNGQRPAAGIHDGVPILETIGKAPRMSDEGDSLGRGTGL